MNYKNLLSGILFLLLNLALIPAWGQGKLIKLIDAETLKPIPFVNVLFEKQKLVFTTNEEGLFVISNSNKDLNDTILFTCLGFLPKKIALNNLSNLGEVRLNQNFVELPNVQIKPRNLKEFETEKPRVKGSISGIPNEQFMVGLSFDSTIFANKKIISVEIFIHKGSYLQTPFRIRFYKLKNRKPINEEIFNQNFVVKAYKFGWNRFNIPSDLVFIPDSGCLVAMEWLDFQSIDYSKIDYSKRDFNIDFKKYKGYYLGMGIFSNKQGNSFGFFKNIHSKNEEWKSTNSLFNNFEHPVFKNQILNPLISLTLQ